jgi:predicted DNA-binding transcriptional regulator YafY
MVAERALSILRLLIEHPRSMDALIDGISQDLKFEWRSYSKETIYRDLRRLRKAGFKIEYIKRIDAYQLKESTVSIKFSPSEFAALASACQSLPPDTSMTQVKVLSGILNTISNLLSPESKEHLACNPHFQMKLKPVTDYTSHQDAIAAIRQAITDGKRIEIGYYGATSEMKQKRVLDPYELRFNEDGVILEGFCHTNQRLMEFKLDRIRHIEMLSTSIDKA